MVRALFSRISHFGDEESSFKYLSNSEQNHSRKQEKHNNASFHKLDIMGKRFYSNSQRNQKQRRAQRKDELAIGKLLNFAIFS